MLRASTYTCISGKLARRQPCQSAFDRLHGGDGNISRGGRIIGISAPGRVKSGRRDQWLTRIVGAVRKIPYLHTKIRERARALAEPLYFPFSLFLLLSLPPSFFAFFLSFWLNLPERGKPPSPRAALLFPLFRAGGTRRPP